MRRSEYQSYRISRRDALRWVGAIAAASGFSGGIASVSHSYMTGSQSKGYGRDPDLLHPPSDLWPLVLGAELRATAMAALDVILPAHEHGPAASALNLADFFDEWISAPYPEQQHDRNTLIPLLEAMDERAVSVQGVAFPIAPVESQEKIVSEFAAYAKYATAFRRFCVLAAAAYYTTPEGLEAIGFIGNTPQLSFEGPPVEVLRQFDRAFKLL